MISRLYIYILFSLLCGVVSVLGDHFGVGMLDYLLFSIFIAVSVVMTKKKFMVPKRYLVILALYVLVMAVTSYMSPYTTGFVYVLIGSIATLMPFILFMVSYNYVLNENHIGRLIDAWICLILVLCGIALIETTVLTSQAQDSTAILKITLIKPGFFASMTNQGTILSLFQYSLSKKKKYVRIALILTSAVVLTVQLKAIVGVMMIWMLYALIMSDKNRRGRAVAAIAVTAIAAIFMMISIPSLSSKIEKYIGLYAGEESYDKVARPALYYQSVNIANDFFPLGSGQGTFGSIPVNMIYNQIYYDYGLDGIYGLGETGDDFKMDTHWSSILGENGYLGTILYLMLFCYPLTFLRKARRLQSYKSIRFIIMTVIIVVMFESLTLCIPGRMAFMFIYAGLLSIICRRITIAGKYYEGSPS